MSARLREGVVTADSSPSSGTAEEARCSSAEPLLLVGSSEAEPMFRWYCGRKAARLPEFCCEKDMLRM